MSISHIVFVRNACLDPPISAIWRRRCVAVGRTPDARFFFLFLFFFVPVNLDLESDACFTAVVWEVLHLDGLTSLQGEMRRRDSLSCIRAICMHNDNCVR